MHIYLDRRHASRLEQTFDYTQVQPDTDLSSEILIDAMHVVMPDMRHDISSILSY